MYLFTCHIQEYMHNLESERKAKQRLFGRVLSLFRFQKADRDNWYAIPPFADPSCETPSAFCPCWHFASKNIQEGYQHQPASWKNKQSCSQSKQQHHHLIRSLQVIPPTFIRINNHRYDGSCSGIHTSTVK